MIKGILLVFVPIGIACLAFATGGTALAFGDGLLVPSLILFVGGVFCAMAGVRAVGSGVFASFTSEAEKRGLKHEIDPAEQKAHFRRALIYAVVGIVIIVVGMLVGGSAMWECMTSVLSA
jgi:hypothetical protein